MARLGSLESLVLSNLARRDFWTGKRILLTGHTGFKGAWMSLLLTRLGATVCGLSLDPAEPSLFALAHIGELVRDLRGDLRDPETVRAAVVEARPDIVFHFAAEAVVRRSLADPATTFATNVGGTVNLLEALRQADRLRAVLIATSDKVYGAGQGRAFAEDAALDGADPYSASKVAQEMVARAYRTAFFDAMDVPLVTLRAGNVLGGGDFGQDRLLPDLVRAGMSGRPAAIRNPDAVRPWQYVLDCLNGYALYAEALCGGRDLPVSLNFGPPRKGIPVARVAQRFEAALDRGKLWRVGTANEPPETATLAISARRAGALLGWRPTLASGPLIGRTAAWYRAWLEGADMRAASLAEIDLFLGAAGSPRR